MRRTRIVPALVTTAAWGLAIAGIWLPRPSVVVLTGVAVTASFTLRARWIEHRAQERAQAAIFEANQREASLIKTIERLTGGAKTGPIAALRDVA